MRQIKTSVRTLVEFIYRCGDIDNTVNAGVTLQEGTRIHQMIQGQYEGFDKEVYLKKTISIDGQTELLLSGRADGIKREPDHVVIDEIKSTFEDLDNIDENYSFMHWAQAKIYGAIYSEEHNLENITVQLSYYSLKSESLKIIPILYKSEDLIAFLNQTIDLYRRWMELSASLQSRAEVTSKALAFPFGQFRRGQDTLAKAVYACVRDGQNLMAEAPTGIGKTMATLFPAMKAYGEGHTEKIFYLTSKSLHRKVALDAVSVLHDYGLDTLTVGLQAKEKMCINDIFSCKPDHCPYAKGHYDRVNDGLYETLVKGGIFDPNYTKSICEKLVLCPFEFALDMTNFAHITVGDYNYFLDPFVFLKRHFSEPSKSTVLIDEAHNLYERARDMYSCPLSLPTLQQAIAAAKDLDPGYWNLLKKVRLALKNNLKLEDDKGLIPNIENKLLNALSKAMLYFLDQGRFSDITKNEDCINQFFEMNRFNKLIEFADDHFMFMRDEDHSEVLLLRCIDPSKLLKESYRLVKTVVGFSATLSPFSFYQEVLGHQESKRLQVGSPFSVENRLLLVNALHSTYQKDRDQTLVPIAKDICRLVEARHNKGNYFVFCPSYAYIDLMAPILMGMLPQAHFEVQKGNMTEDEREAFLATFSHDTEIATIGIVVLGGAFSEGVDLQGNRLTGVVVIGVGMPVLSKERLLMRDFYDGQQVNGFDFAFTYPGLNKVFQAGGRLIRTETDKGVLMVICKRFGERRYLEEFPRHWRPYTLIKAPDHLNMALDQVESIFE